jgi:hypothetical protein
VLLPGISCKAALPEQAKNILKLNPAGIRTAFLSMRPAFID